MDDILGKRQTGLEIGEFGRCGSNVLSPKAVAKEHGILVVKVAGLFRRELCSQSVLDRTKQSYLTNIALILPQVVPSTGIEASVTTTVTT